MVAQNAVTVPSVASNMPSGDGSGGGDSKVC